MGTHAPRTNPFWLEEGEEEPPVILPDGDLEALRAYLARGVVAEDFTWLLPDFLAWSGRLRARGDEEDEEEPSLEDLGPAERGMFESWVEEVALPRLMYRDPAAFPAYISLRHASVVPADTWLVHFTDHMRAVACDGFSHGENDARRLALTTWKSDRSRHAGPGWNYGLEAVRQDAFRAADEGRYGRNAVLFQAPAVRVWHIGDEEWQAIFWGPAVTSLVPLQRTADDRWKVMHAKTGKVLRRGSYPDVIAWVRAHAGRAGVSHRVPA